MHTLKPQGRRKLGLTTGLVIALATLGLAVPLTTATAQSGSRVCGVFWYAQLPDSSNGNKQTWFTLGMAEEIDMEEYTCETDVDEKYPKPDLAFFRRAYPGIPASVDQAESWVVSRIDRVTCEDFAEYIAKPPNGAEILGRGQNWPVGDADPCQYWERSYSNPFWFKHL
jgi:hypothetical protein